MDILILLLAIYGLILIVSFLWMALKNLFK